jgi:hypothetical protein
MKKNRSGSTSVVVVDKSRGGFCELKTIGVSADEKKVSELSKAGTVDYLKSYFDEDVSIIA